MYSERGNASTPLMITLMYSEQVNATSGGHGACAGNAGDRMAREENAKITQQCLTIFVFRGVLALTCSLYSAPIIIKYACNHPFWQWALARNANQRSRPGAPDIAGAAGAWARTRSPFGAES